MKINRYISSAIAAVGILMLPGLESCRTEICYNHFPVADVSLSWEQEWERDYGMGHSAVWNNNFYGFGYDDLRPGPAEWVSLVRYTEEGEMTGEKYLSPEGGEMMLNPTSDSSFLLYNGDTEYIMLTDLASINDAKATSTSRTRTSISYIMERHPDVRSVNPPDILYSAYVGTLPEVGIHEKDPLPVKMQPLVYTYLVRYEFKEGLEYVALARGAMAGMAESVYLLDGRTSDETTILLYDCDVKDYGCEAQVRTFGVPGFPDRYYGRANTGGSELPYTLNLEVMLKNGKTAEFNFDIADQLRNQPRGGVITVGGIRIEQEQAAAEPVESGFDVDLDGWGSGEDIDMPMGVEYTEDEEKRR